MKEQEAFIDDLGEKETYLLGVLQRKILELKEMAEKSEEHTEHSEHHGTEYLKGVNAGFISGLGLAIKILIPNGTTWPKAKTMLDNYNEWAQSFNRQRGQRRRAE